MIGFRKEYTEKGLPVFVSEEKQDCPRIAFVSDTHYAPTADDFGGVTRQERHAFMIDTLIAKKDSFDCIIINGDTVTRNEQECWKYENPGKPLPVADTLKEVKEVYLDRLLSAGIPYFVVHAGHEALYSDEFQERFGYEKNYALLFGDTVVFCFDTFGGERKPELYMETAVADIPDAIADAAIDLLQKPYIRRAFVVSHYPFASLPCFCRVVKDAKVIAVFAGHSHYNEVDSFLGKPMLQTGHFSRANMRMKSWGLEFKAFVPTLKEAPIVIDEDGKPHPDWSNTGSPWQYRMLDCRKDGSIESYMVFPERDYLPFTAVGCDAPAFHQDYVEARPSFLGHDAPIDKSYWFFP